MLKDDFECMFATRFLNPFIENEISGSGGKVVKLNEKKDNHFLEFLDFIKSNDIVVLDNYFFDTKYQKKIKEKGCKLICLDDMHDKHYVADAVINHAPGLSPNQFSIENYTKLYLGLNYSLLREDFLNVKPRKRDSLKRVLLCMGGADKFDITSKLIQHLQKYKYIEDVDVIIGSSYQHEERLKKTIKKYNQKINLFSNLSSKEMVRQMQKCDCAILPASTICFEALATGIPFFVGYTVDNQKELYHTLTSLYGIPGLGNLINCVSIPFEKLELNNPKLGTFSTEGLISIFKSYDL